MRLQSEELCGRIFADKLYGGRYSADERTTITSRAGNVEKQKNNRRKEKLQKQKKASKKRSSKKKIEKEVSQKDFKEEKK